jgi:hypothetical protein
MFTILDFTKEDIIAFEVKDKVEKKDYEKLIPLLEKTEKEYGKIKLYIEITEDIEGIEASALWKDVKTYFQHIGNIKKVAVLGHDGAIKAITKMANPFASAKIEYFPIQEAINAKNWLQNNNN